MARYTGPKMRLMRREGQDLGLKSRSKVSVTKKISVKPGVHGHKQSRKKASSFGLQLREKQKVKRVYGMLERQFRRFFSMALKKSGDTGENLMKLLEQRLDNIVYRLGYAPTRAAARQMVNHGHVYVNEVRVNIPSYLVKEGDQIRISDRSYESVSVKTSMELVKEADLPKWLERSGRNGKVVRLPTRDEITTSANEASIIEFYSR